jgi:Amt family ammonium transporter
LTWFFMDISLNRKLSFLGAINGLICGLVAITPAAGYVDGYGAMIVYVGVGGASVSVAGLFAGNRTSSWSR